MGLDSYLFVEQAGDTEFNLSYRLWGGVFSEHGSDGSFRGKMYAPIISEATGYSLYAERLTPEQVKKLAQKLNDWWEKVKDKPLKEIEKSLGGVELRYLAFLDAKTDAEVEASVKKQIQALVELFNQAAEKGCQYASWG